MSDGAVVEDDLTKAAPTSSTGKAPEGVPFWGDDPGAWDSFYLAGVKLPGLCSVSGYGYRQRLQRKKVPGKNGATLTTLGHEPAEVTITIRMWTAEHFAAFAKLAPVLKPKPATTTTFKVTQTSVTYPTPKAKKKDEYVFGFQEEKPYGPDTAPVKVPYQPGAQPFGKRTTTTSTSSVTTGGPKALSVAHPALTLYRITKLMVIEAGLPEDKGKGVYEVRIKAIEYNSGKSRSAGVNTPNAAFDLTKLGPGAVAKRVEATRRPSRDNTGP